MQKVLPAACIAIGALLLLKFSGFEPTLSANQKEQALTPLIFKVDNSSSIYPVSRIGINIGRWSSEDTLQYSANIVINPGFEGNIERTVVIVSDSNQNNFSDEAGLGYPNNYWNDAEFDIRTGKSAGQRGVIKNSLNSGTLGLPQYYTQNPLPPIDIRDVIVLTKVNRFVLGYNWRVNDENLVQIDPYQTRDSSLGSQSVRLKASRTNQAKLAYYMDTIAERTGKKFPINGPWEFSFWAKTDAENGRITTTFKRKNQKIPFVNEVIPLTTDWKEYRINFQGNDSGKPEHLELSFVSDVANQSVWIDDISLKRTTENSFFRPEVVAALKKLSPSYLREFPPVGNTWENYIAPLSKRKAWASQIIGNKKQNIFNYSFSDFLTLCHDVGANPWIIIPPVFSDYELDQLGKYLGENAPKSKFSEIIVEFGAENWNWLNRSLGIPYEKEYTQAADRAFNIVAKAVDKRSNLKFLVNGQYTITDSALQFLKKSKLAQGVAIAPYFFHRLNKATPDRETLVQLFKDEGPLLNEIADTLFSRGKWFSISELNLHTTLGDAKAYERNRVVAGAASGSALAKKVLEALATGAYPVMINSLGQYDTPTWEIDDFVSLWGIVSDFGPPLVFRPTGLAVVMLNQVIGGGLYTVKPTENAPKESSALTIEAFKTKEGWTAAIVSSAAKPLAVEIEFPKDGASLPETLLILDTRDPFATNESSENVRILEEKVEAREQKITLTVPPWGFVVLSK